MREETTSAPGRLLRGKAATAYCGVPYTTFRLWALKGCIPVVRIPGPAALLFDRKDLDLLIERSKEQAHERWEERLDELKALAEERRRQRAAAGTPAIRKRGRWRWPGVTADPGTASGAAPAR